MAKSFKITLADGTQLKNLELNGNNFISKNEIQDSVFEDNLDTVEIKSPDGETQVMHDCFLAANREIDGEWWFIIVEKSEDQKEKEDLYAEIEAQAEAIMELAELIGGAE